MNDTTKPSEYLGYWGEKYKNDLLTDILPFWLKYGIDHENGGYFTCLDRDGSLLDTNKSVWFQGRFAFILAYAYNNLEKQAEWLEACKNGIDFIEKYCFDTDGRMFYEVTKTAYAKLLVKNGLKGVFINGSSGEGYMLTDEERMKLAERWVEVAPSGFKVIVHVGSTCVKASHKLAAHAQKIGAWGIGAMASPFPKVNRIEELVKYCEEIASGAPELPFYYYHIPAFNGAFLPMVELLKAVDGRIPNFAGIKYTYESLYEYNQCRLYKDGKFDMLHGQDETILPCLAMGGAQGGIGGTTNYNGKELTGILEAWAAGDLETARERQNFSQEVINVICRYRGNIVGGKRIMKLIGLDLGKNRTPFQNMTDAEETAMKAELEAIHFFDRCNKF